MPTSVTELLESRDSEYKGAWRFTGRLLALLHPRMEKLLTEAGEFAFVWIIILNKMIRILGSPRHLDSWKDIEGYAHLVVTEIEGGASNEVPGK